MLENSTLMQSVVMGLWLIAGCTDQRLTPPAASGLLQRISDLDPSVTFQDPQVQKLCAAIEANDSKSVNDLISAGVDVNAVGSGNVTPLFFALPLDRGDAFQALLEAGADPNVKLVSDIGTKGFLKAGDTVTLLTTRQGTVARLKQVLDHGGDALAVDARTGDSLIHLVIKSGSKDRKEKIDLLISRGAPLDTFSKNEVTPVMLAVTWGGQYDIALQLLEAGADYRLYKPNSNSKLVHKVVTEEGRIRQNSEAQKQDYATLKAWLEEHGESLSLAREDSVRWSEWGKAMEPKEYRYHMDREIKERIERDEAKAAAAAGATDDAQLPGQNPGAASDSKTQNRTHEE